MSTQPQDLSALAVRLTSIEFHVDSAEKEIERLRSLLSNYVPVRENDLKLQSIQETVKRIESDVVGAKMQLTELNTKLAMQETDAQKREASQRESQDKLQIRILYSIVGTVITVLTGVLIGYLTHIFH